jgi:hypothetical protein
MTLDPTMLAAEERLQRMASDMPAPDVDAGWAALSAKLEPPLAQVIPLRGRSFGRPIALAAAATLLVAGSAFAAIGHGGADSEHVAPVVSVEAPGLAFAGPHAHAPFQGPPATPNVQSPVHTGDPTDVTASPPDSGGSTSTEGSADGHTDQNKPQDDPNDLDQGTGNDGSHNDHGGGNNGTEGSQPRSQGGGGTEGGAGDGVGNAHANGP